MQERQHQRGASLIDVLVGTTIIVIGVLGLSVASSKTEAAQTSLQVQRAVESTLEQQSSWIRQTSFEDLIDQHHGRRFSIREDGGVRPLLHSADPDWPDHAGVVTVSAVDDAEIASGDLLQVVLNVDGSGPSGQIRASRVLLLSRLGSNG